MGSAIASSNCVVELPNGIRMVAGKAAHSCAYVSAGEVLDLSGWFDNVYYCSVTPSGGLTGYYVQGVNAATGNIRLHVDGNGNSVTAPIELGAANACALMPTGTDFVAFGKARLS